MTIDFDLTFVLQMALFSLLIVLLKPLLFDPVLRVFEAREQMTDGSKDAARAMQEEAGTLLQRYERELEKVHEVARVERDRIRAETARLEAEVMAQARESANQIVEQGRAELARETAQLRAELRQHVEGNSRELAEGLLGRGLA